MKRLFICTVVLMLITFSGCSKGASADEFGNVNDVDSIYAFMSENGNSISREEFDENYTPYYFDMNADGNLDVCYNTEEWYGKLIYIASVQGGFQLIDADDHGMHKISSIHSNEGFIVVTGENSDNAYRDNRTDIYHFDGEKIIFLDQFVTSLFNGAQTYFEGKGTIETVDGYRELVYTYNQYEVDENENKTQQIKVDLSFVFDDSTGQYITTENGENYNYLENPVASNPGNPAKSDKYMLSQLKNGDKIGNFTINQIDAEGDDIGFALEGAQKVEGYLAYNEMDDGYYLDVETKILDKPIVCDWKAYNDSYELTRFALWPRNEQEVKDQLPASAREQIENGNRVKISATIKDIGVGLYYQSEGFESAELLDVTVLD